MTALNQGKYLRLWHSDSQTLPWHTGYGRWNTHRVMSWDHCLTHHISEDARTASSIREALVILHKEHLTLDHNCWLEHTQTALDTQSKCRAHSLMHYIFILEYPGVYWKWSHGDVETGNILRRTMWLFQSGNTSSGQKTLNATQPEEEDKRAVFLQWWGQTRRLHTCACSCSFIVPLRSCSVYGTSRLRVVLFWIGRQFNIGQDELHRHDEGGVWISAHGRLVLTWNNKKHSGRMGEPMLLAPNLVRGVVFELEWKR